MGNNWRPEGGGYFTEVPLSNGLTFHFGYSDISHPYDEAPRFNVEMVCHDPKLDWYYYQDSIWDSEGESVGPGLSEILPLALPLLDEVETIIARNHGTAIAHVGSVSDRLLHVYRRFLIPRSYVPVYRGYEKELQFAL